MKTPGQWKEDMFVDLADTEERTIAWIQSDAREGMVPAAELRETVELLKWFRTYIALSVRFERERLDSRCVQELARLETLLGEKEAK